MKNVEQALSIYPEIYSHSSSVADLATRFSKYTGMFTASEITTIGLGSMLHDIGKCFIPKDILFKEGKLTAEEFEVVKRHAKYGYKYLLEGESAIQGLISEEELEKNRLIHEKINEYRKDITPEILYIVIQHHERMDGSGYPMGLKGDEIHPYARLVALCDVYDAITSVRCYKPQYDPFYALECIREGLGTIFDEQLSLKFLEFMEKGSSASSTETINNIA